MYKQGTQKTVDKISRKIEQRRQAFDLLNAHKIRDQVIHIDDGKIPKNNFLDIQVKGSQAQRERKLSMLLKQKRVITGISAHMLFSFTSINMDQKLWKAFIFDIIFNQSFS